MKYPQRERERKGREGERERDRRGNGVREWWGWEGGRKGEGNMREEEGMYEGGMKG